MENNNTAKPLRIMIVEPRGTGGMIHYAYQMSTALAKAGANVTLVTSTVYEMDEFPHNFTLRKQMRLWSTIESQQIESSLGWIGRAVHSVFRKIRRGVRAIRLIIEWIRLDAYLIKEKPDIIQFGKIEFSFEAVFLHILKGSGLTLSQICHEFELREQGNGFLVNFSNRLYRWVYDSFSILFFHGDSNQKRFLELFDIPQENLHNIEHGNEGLFLSKKQEARSVSHLRNTYGLEEEAPIVLFFGNIMPSKGVPDLIKGFAQVYQKNKRARLVIAGNPSKFMDVNELKKLAAEMNSAEAIVFDLRYIPLEEVGVLMEMCTVAIYPYLNSTQSGALQVAYAFGKPVIATKVGGLPEVVDDGKSGFIIPPSSPNDLANAILKLLENPELAKQMGLYAKHLSDTRFSWDAIARKMLAIYNSIKASPSI